MGFDWNLATKQVRRFCLVVGGIDEDGIYDWPYGNKPLAVNHAPKFQKGDDLSNFKGQQVIEGDNFNLIIVGTGPEHAMPAGPTCLLQAKTTASDYSVATPTTQPGASGFDFTLSQYGSCIPIVFGSDKLTGNVFWASSITTSTYTVGTEIKTYDTLSFAAGFAEGEIEKILRIWVGDKLVFDQTVEVDVNGVIQPNAKGVVVDSVFDLTEGTPFFNINDSEKKTRVRAFTGAETQLPEGIMADTEGLGLVPGYRGLSYILFENFVVTDRTVPNIYVELSGNTSSVKGRIFGTFPGTKDQFDQHNQQLMASTPEYGTLVVDGNDSADPTNKKGFMVYNLNSLKLEDEYEIKTSAGMPTFTGGLTNVTANGIAVITIPDGGNSASTYSIHLGTGIVAKKRGPAGNSTGHDRINGFAPLQAGGFTFSAMDDVSGNPYDFIVGLGSANKSIGVMRVSRDGRLNMIGTLNNVLQENKSSAVLMNLHSSVKEKNATYISTKTTEGLDSFIFTHALSEKQQIHVNHLKMQDPDDATVNMSNMVLSLDVGNIDLDSLGGRGIVHEIHQVLVDAEDGNIILLINISGSSTDMVIKYSPFTGKIVWRANPPAKFLSRFSQSKNTAMNLQSNFVWIDSQNNIVTVDLKSGQITVVAPDIVANDAFPAASSASSQVYDGRAQTVTYFSDVAGKEITRYYIDRFKSNDAEVDKIVENLLLRVGIKKDQIQIDDLQSLEVTGYTANDCPTLRSVFSELSSIFRFDVVESNGKILYKTRGDTPAQTIPHAALKDLGTAGWLEEVRQPDFVQTRKLNLTYKDIGREYKPNVQSYNLPKYTDSCLDSEGAIDVTVPVVLDANKAKALAEVLLYSKIIYSSAYKGELPIKYAHLDPADVVTIQRTDTESVVVRLRDVILGQDRAIRFTASQEDPDIHNDTVVIFGNTGRFVASEIPALPAKLELALLNIPFRSNAEAVEVDGARLSIYSVINTRPGAESPVQDITVHYGGGDALQLPSPTTFPTWGYVITPPDFVGDGFGTDFTSTVKIKLKNTSAFGVPTSAASLEDMIETGQINLCLLGQELVQFQTVVSEGNDIYTLTVLNRGKFGTDRRITSHISGEKFFLLGNATGVLDTENYIRHAVPTPTTSSSYQQVKGHIPSMDGIYPPYAGFYFPENLLPMRVSDISSSFVTGDAKLSWSRRDRLGYQWADDGTTIGEVAPMNEGSEKYRVYLFKDPTTFAFDQETTYLRKVEVTAQEHTYLVADQVLDGYDRNTEDLYFWVTQLSDTIQVPDLTGVDSKLEHIRV